MAKKGYLAARRLMNRLVYEKHLELKGSFFGQTEKEKSKKLAILRWLAVV
jgi:hypothetical protein